MPKAPKPKRAERPAPSLGNAVNLNNNQALQGRVSRTARPMTTLNQQNIMPRPPMQPHPAGPAPPASGGGMQYPTATAPPPGSKPAPALALSTDSLKTQPTNRDIDFWSLISGMLNVDDEGKPLRSPEIVVNNIGCFIYEPVNKMPAPDGPCANAVQAARLTQLVGFLLKSGCITPETLGKAVSHTWFKYQTNEQTNLAQKLWKFVAQIHRVHHALLGIPEICQPRSVHNLPMWVDLLVPHENDSPKAKAEREACVVSPDVWKVMNETAAKCSGPGRRRYLHNHNHDGNHSHAVLSSRHNLRHNHNHIRNCNHSYTHSCNRNSNHK
ncbi:hypothetical protein PGQ11_011407 [Apiospora arundinis]|uniref:Uncharacterized protein n=1 Tax=Apiospora arundinis TaxID=335852 RepID=A0ABR2HZI6_9PEZI